MKQIVVQMPNARLVMVGIGPLEDEIKANCAEGTLAGKVMLAGSRTDAPAIVAASDLMVLPSLSEGLPLTLLEAAMQGRAMVASDTGGIPDVVRPGSTGLLVSPRSSASIANAVIELLQNDERRRRLGQNARKLWEENYTADVMTDRMENLYNDLLAARK
jgi:glycosyltransferase involved in cell wall biosynthesis